MSARRSGRALATAVLLAILGLASVGAAGETNRCAGRVNAVVIRGRSHQLLLCRNQKVEGEFVVSLGRGGLGKHAAGDNRTPLGRYPLGVPRASAEFGLFIPVGYPTAEQRRRGYSGAEIGIHGPKKRWRWLGRLANAADWTRGCIAVNHVEDIRTISAWVSAHRTSEVEILDE